MTNALSRLDLEIDQNPHKKIIREFHIYTVPPLVNDDGFLTFFNKLHIDSTDPTIINQLMMSAGDTFSSNVLIQSEIELLYPGVRNVAIILPVFPKNKPLTNNQVDILVITKDAYSLRMSGNFSLSGSYLKELNFSISENNIWGTNKTGTLNFSLKPYILTLLAQYYDPNLLNTGTELSLNQGLILSRMSGKYEGVQGLIKVEYPHDSEEIRWGLLFNLDYLYTPRYIMDENHIRLFTASDAETAEEKYQWFKIKGNVSATHSFHGHIKHNITFGYGLHYQEPTLLPDFQLTKTAAEEFKKKVLPAKEFQSFLILNYDFFQNFYESMHDYNTFTLQEWIRTGPAIFVSNHLGGKILFSDNNFWSPHIDSSFTFMPMPTSIIRFSLGGGAQRQKDQWDNQLIKAQLLFVSPVLFGVGRIILNGIYAKLWNDTNKTPFTLGGYNGLRGLMPDHYSGNNLVNTNLEFRTVSWPLWSLRLGAVAFYDFGAAFDDDTPFQLAHALGIGARIFYLPLSRSVFRIDIGIPVAGPKSGIKNTLLSFGVDQAF